MILGAYALLVILATLPLYRRMLSQGLDERVAVYYNRKIIHMLAGGTIALLTPLLYTSPLLPFLSAILLAGFLATMRRLRPMYWFQVPENAYEVNFALGWGFSLLTLWLLLGKPHLAVLPAIFISYGDAMTGIVRNTLFRRRTKHWIGNIAMAALVIPLGYLYAGALGALAGLASSIVERLEYGPIDDNLLIALTTTGLMALTPLL